MAQGIKNRLRLIIFQNRADKGNIEIQVETLELGKYFNQLPWLQWPAETKGLGRLGGICKLPDQKLYF